VDYVALKVVDLRFKMLAFRGACGEPSRRFAPTEVSPVPLIPQDKEGFDSVTPHEENVIFIFEESRTLHSNQLVNEENEKKSQKQQSFREELK
jgi:hypothetical protein